MIKKNNIQSIIYNMNIGEQIKNDIKIQRKKLRQKKANTKNDMNIINRAEALLEKKKTRNYKNELNECEKKLKLLQDINDIKIKKIKDKLKVSDAKLENFENNNEIIETKKDISDIKKDAEKEIQKTIDNYDAVIENIPNTDDGNKKEIILEKEKQTVINEIIKDADDKISDINDGKTIIVNKEKKKRKRWRM